MRRNSVSTCGLICVGLAAGLGLATVGTYAANYLTKVGPPALRFQPEREVIFPLPPLPKEDKPAPQENTNQAALFQMTPTLTMMTDVVLAVLADKGLIADVSTNSMLPEQTSVFTAASFAAPRANDMLVINPQMLVDFFRPTAGFTNAGAMGGSVPVEFMPATPLPPVSSSATYKNQ